MADTKEQSTGPTKVKAQRRNRDEEVITAAIEIFSEQGYSATSIQDIADRVGVLKGSLYHYFSSKEGLLYRILQEAHNEADAIWNEVADLGLDPLATIEEYLRRLFIWYLENEDRANIYFNESAHLAGTTGKDIRNRGKEFSSRLRTLISKARDQHQIAVDVDPSIVTQFLIGSLNSVRLWPRRPRSKQGRQQLADNFVGLTRNTLQATPSSTPSAP